MPPKRATRRDEANWPSWAKRLAIGAAAHLAVDLVTDPHCPRCKQRTCFEWCRSCRRFVWPTRHWPLQQ